jgi:hypothetical protein
MSDSKHWLEFEVDTTVSCAWERGEGGCACAFVCVRVVVRQSMCAYEIANTSVRVCECVRVRA